MASLLRERRGTGASLLPGTRRSVSPAGGSRAPGLIATHRLLRGDAHEEVISLSKQAWGGGRLFEQEGLNSNTVWHVIASLSWSDALDEAEEIIEAALEAARREGSIVTLAMGFYARSWPRYWRGDLSTAASDAQAAVEAWRGEFTTYLPSTAYWLALAQLELGDVDAAAEALDLPDADERWDDTNMYGALLAGQGCVAMARRDHEEAIELFERCESSALESRCASMTGPTSPARAPSRTSLTTPTSWRAWPWSCCEYAPPRPVRLLGVRVASFEEVVAPPLQAAKASRGSDAQGQLAAEL